MCHLADSADVYHTLRWACRAGAPALEKAKETIALEMKRSHVSVFVLLLVALTVTGEQVLARPTFASSPLDECAAASPAEAAQVHQAAHSYMLGRYPAVYGSSEVRRVVGDWALVVVTPKVPADRAAVVLHRVAPGQWQVVAGPGTAFPPGARPAGMPAELLESDGRCGGG